MNSSQVRETIKEQSEQYRLDVEQYIVNVQQWESDFTDAIKKFLLNNAKRFLLIETDSADSCVARILQVLKKLKENPLHSQVIEKYLDIENQTFLRWDQFVSIVKPLETFPKLTNLLLCEVKNTSKLEQDDGEVLKKIVDRLKISAFKKVIFISSRKDVLNGYLEELEMRECLKIDEFKRKITSWVNSKIADESEALLKSASCGRLKDVEELLKNGVDEYSVVKLTTALRIAAENNYKDIVLLLLKYGAVSSHDASEVTPLYVAAQNGHADVVLVLIENDVDINAKNYENRTALMQAVCRGHNNIVKILLECGANVNFVDNVGKNALHYAALENKLEIVKTLLHYGADLSTKDNEGFTPLDYAARSDNLEIFNVLKEANGDPTINVSNNDG